MLSEISVSAGEGQPYIVVPEQFKLSVFEWLKDKIPCTFPRSGGPNAVLELVDSLPKDTEMFMDEWFASLSAQVQKRRYGDEDHPSCIIWHFDPNTCRQMQAERLENLRCEQSQKPESLYSI